MRYLGGDSDTVLEGSNVELGDRRIHLIREPFRDTLRVGLVFLIVLFCFVFQKRKKSVLIISALEIVRKATKYE